MLSHVSFGVFSVPCKAELGVRPSLPSHSSAAQSPNALEVEMLISRVLTRIN